MLVKKFNFNFLLGSFEENLLFLQKKMSQKKSFIVLPASLNDFKQSEEEKYKKVYGQVDFSTTDGMPFVFYFRFLNKTKKIERTYGPDMMKEILSRDKKHRHFLSGTTSENLSALKKKLKKDNPSLQIVGTYSPPFAEVEVFYEKLLEKLKKTKAEVLWVGLSSPKQVELASLIKKNHPKIKIFCVGAAFDFLSGEKDQSPRFLQNLGLEWLYRLIKEPKRLAKRYLLDIPLFLLKKFISSF